ASSPGQTPGPVTVITGGTRPSGPDRLHAASRMEPPGWITRERVPPGCEIKEEAMAAGRRRGTFAPGGTRSRRRAHSPAAPLGGPEGQRLRQTGWQTQVRT